MMTVTWWNVLADSCGIHQDVCVERRIEPLISTAGREEGMASDRQGLVGGLGGTKNRRQSTRKQEWSCFSR